MVLEKVINIEKLMLDKGMGTNQSAGKKDILTAKETAQYLNVCSLTIHNWAKKGTLPKHKIGGTRIGYKIQDVEKLLSKVESRNK